MTQEAQGSADEAEAMEELARLMKATLAPLGREEAEPFGGTIPRKTLRDLQWDQLIEQVSRETVTPEGALLVARLGPLPDQASVERRLEEVRETMELLETDDAPPLRGVRDIGRALRHVVREGVLVAEDLEAIARNCDVASRCARYYGNRRERVPHLARVGEQLDALRELRGVLDHAIEPGGRLSDQASPDLGRLRRAVQNQHDRLKSRVDAILRSQEMDTYLQDDYYTLREERYVVPIRVGAKGAVSGIVHDYSSSGQTAFIEPAELIELNNQLQWARIELKEEEDRILQRLSRLVASNAEALEHNEQVLAYLDVVTAVARFGRRIDASIPTITDQAVELRQARHPLLFLKYARIVDGQPVNDTIPNDIALDPQKRVLVISGPNTGGKTVLLKTIGLCSLMVRCGLPLPVDTGSRLPLYEGVFTDIGDEQSIERDLSTFSGHVVNIKSFLDQCGPETLVLLDELFTGTDPMQGAALAVALLEDLATRGATTAVTTHMEGLKTLAYQSEVFANASMGFDLQTLSPTYHMTMGVPGSSFAVRIAERLGFPDYLVDRAKKVLEGQEHHSVEEVLTSLEDQMTEVRKEQQRLRHARQEAERTQQKFRDKYNNLLAKEREMVHAETRKLRGQLREARGLIRDKIKELQQARVVERGDYTQQELQAMREELRKAEEVMEQASERTRAPEPGPKGLARVQPDELEEGMSVFAQPFKREGVVVDYEAGNAQALIQIGALKATVDVDKLYYATERQRRAHMRGRTEGAGGADGQARPAPAEPVLLPQTSDNTVDLRGLRADEAVEKLDLFLDSAYLNNIEGVYIIHGHGTGALKRAVRGHLPSSPYVTDFRRGEREEGGDGVTVAFLKRGA